MIAKAIYGDSPESPPRNFRLQQTIATDFEEATLGDYKSLILGNVTISGQFSSEPFKIIQSKEVNNPYLSGKVCWLKGYTDFYVNMGIIEPRIAKSVSFGLKLLAPKTEFSIYYADSTTEKYFLAIQPNESKLFTITFPKAIIKIRLEPWGVAGLEIDNIIYKGP